MIRNEWDGADRRSYDDRRNINRYDDRSHDDIGRDRIIEIQQPAAPVPANKWISPGIIAPAVLAIITGSGGFIFDLYNRVATADFKLTSLSEKLDDNKVLITDLKLQLKEMGQDKQKMEDHISSVEQTVMDIYRQKK